MDNEVVKPALHGIGADLLPGEVGDHLAGRVGVDVVALDRALRAVHVLLGDQRAPIAASAGHTARSRASSSTTKALTLTPPASAMCRQPRPAASA